MHIFGIYMLINHYPVKQECKLFKKNMGNLSKHDEPLSITKKILKNIQFQCLYIFDADTLW